MSYVVVHVPRASLPLPSLCPALCFWRWRVNPYAWTFLENRFLCDLLIVFALPALAPHGDLVFLQRLY